MPFPEAVHATYQSLLTVTTNTILITGGALVPLIVCVLLCQILHRLDSAMHGHLKDGANKNWMDAETFAIIRGMLLVVTAGIYIFYLIYRAMDLNEALFDATITVITTVVGVEIGLAVVLAVLMGLLSLAMYLNLL